MCVLRAAYIEAVVRVILSTFRRIWMRLFHLLAGSEDVETIRCALARGCVGTASAGGTVTSTITSAEVVGQVGDALRLTRSERILTAVELVFDV